MPPGAQRAFDAFSPAVVLKETFKGDFFGKISSITMLQVDSLLGASTVAGEPASAKKQKSSPKDGSSFLAQQSGAMDRPQDRFQDAVDNSNSPFVHKFEHVREWQVSGWIYFCM